MSKHTPGPWTLPKFGGWEKELEIPEPQVWVDYDDVDRDEAEANARLVAAAPHLLEVLNGIANADQSTWEPEYRSAEEFKAWAQNIARAAIAKAVTA